MRTLSSSFVLAALLATPACSSNKSSVAPATGATGAAATPPSAAPVPSPAAVAATERYTRELYDCATRGRKGCVVTSMRRGGDPNAPIGPRQRSAMHAAAAGGHNEVVGEMLNFGANPNVKDEEGNTALHLAAMAGHKGTVQRLIRGGADKTALNNAGKIPADVATPGVKGFLM